MFRSSRARGERKTSFLISFYSRVFLIVFLDQLTKYLALSKLTPGETIPLIGGIFHLTLVHNQGIAFGFFRRYESLLFILITLSLVVLLVYGHYICKEKKPISGVMDCRVSHAFSRWGIALILGGAVGNWIDRVRFHAVIDFLDFRFWPVFNLADTAITIGVCLYLILLVKKS